MAMLCFDLGLGSSLVDPICLSPSFTFDRLVVLFFIISLSLSLSPSHSCLKAIRQLQKNGHIPSDPSLFKSYAEYGHFVDVRVAALEAVIDYTRGTLNL